MDLSKMPNEKKLSLCRYYFKAGFAFLPFIWFVNALWFFREAFGSNKYEEQPQIRRYVIYSAIGALVWFVGISAWVIIFQLNRASWGVYGDYISFITPLGRA